MSRAFWAGALLMLGACGSSDPVEWPDAGLSRDAQVDGGHADGSQVADDGGEAIDSGVADAGEPVDSGEPVETDGGSDPCAQPRARSIVSLTMEPSAITVEKGHQTRLAVSATFDDGCVAQVTGSLYYQTGDSAIARVVDAPPADPQSSLLDKAVEGVARGETTVVASTQEGGGGVASAPVPVTVEDNEIVPGSTETRAVWVTRFAFHSDATQGPADIRRIINEAADNNFNAVYFQVRGVADAYYRSSIVPWWKGGTGTLGGDPGWDPLRVAIDAAHGRGIQLHAYINAMSGWTKSGTTPQPIPDSAPGAPQHILKQHPEYVCKSASGQDDVSEYTYIGADPGFIAHFADVVEELITNYDVDGVHMDRIRTPGTGYCHTPALDALFAQQGGTWADFQRAQIDKVVEAVYQRVLATKPSVIVSAAVWGIYKRLPGCSTSQGYYDYYQDSLGWMSKGIIDQLNPMMYWDLNPGSCTDWGALLDTFIAGANGRQIVAGMHVLDNQDSPTFSRIAARIEDARSKNVAGHIVFASAYLDQYDLWGDYLAGPYAEQKPPTPVTHR